MSLYTDLIDAGIPVSNWQSDLYCPVNETTTALVKKHGKTASKFRSAVDGELTYEVNFAFDPFWERRGFSMKEQA